MNHQNTTMIVNPYTQQKISIFSSIGKKLLRKYVQYYNNYSNKNIQRGGNLGSQTLYEKVYAMADIHGDFEMLLKTLRNKNLIDENNDWIAQNTLFIQTGDMIDRGEGDFKVLSFLKKIQEQAQNSELNSKVVILLGNHEFMNLLGNTDSIYRLRYTFNVCYTYSAYTSSNCLWRYGCIQTNRKTYEQKRNYNFK